MSFQEKCQIFTFNSFSIPDSTESELVFTPTFYTGERLRKIKVSINTYDTAVIDVVDLKFIFDSSDFTPDYTNFIYIVGASGTLTRLEDCMLLIPKIHISNSYSSFEFDINLLANTSGALTITRYINSNTATAPYTANMILEIYSEITI